MKFQSNNLINVKYYHKNGLIKMGRLAYQNKKVFFEYDQDFLDLGLELSPFKLPLQSSIITCQDQIFAGLFGIFNDSLPDGWGRLLLDRKLAKLGINPHQINILDRLLCVGKQGIGALTYEPEISDNHNISDDLNLDIIATECEEFIKNDNEEFIDDLLIMNSSFAGARPKILAKILVNIEQNSKKLKITHNNDNSSDNWIIKFRSASDPQDIGSIEYAYYLMAIAAGLEMAEAQLFPSKKCSGYFGVKRFDRTTKQTFHMHTISGLLHAPPGQTTIDYKDLLAATMHLTKNINQCEKLFRHIAFNVFAHNRDDHSKNFAFLMDYEGNWQLSPSYDLTFSNGPYGQHSILVMNEGQNPQISHLLQLAKAASIKEKTALEIINQVKEAISKWQLFAKDAMCSAHSTKLINDVINP